MCIGRPNDDNLHRMLAIASGILIIGGTDLNPTRYKEKNKFALEIDKERDRVEIYLAHHAIKHKIPILGICRGMQAINVALGGTLYQDVMKEMPGAIAHDFHHDGDGKFRARHLIGHKNTIVQNTRLSKIILKKTYDVNSLHHQGIKKLGAGLIASAHSPDGLIEGIEYVHHPFAIGVEWHPEELRDVGSKKLFAEFICQSREFSRKKNTHHQLHRLNTV